MIDLQLEHPERGWRGRLVLDETWVRTQARGQELRKREFPSAHKALRYFRRRLRSWQARGYLIGQQNLELLRAIAADPESDDARLVYGDWLQEQGDPRGKLIALQAAPNTEESLGFSEARWLDQHRWHFYGCETPRVAAQWRLGFADSLEFRFPHSERDPHRMRQEIRSLLLSPTGFFVRELSIHIPFNAVSWFWTDAGRPYANGLPDRSDQATMPGVDLSRATVFGPTERMIARDIVGVIMDRNVRLLGSSNLQTLRLFYPRAVSSNCMAELGEFANKSVRLEVRAAPPSPPGPPAPVPWNPPPNRSETEETE